jgi:pimeloyl-ACP methyl ester carboxylesterase
MRLLRILPLLLLASPLLAEIEVPAEWLVISPVDNRGRRPFNPDAVYEKYLLAPGAVPRAGDPVRGTRGERTWRWVKADEKGQVGGRFSWAFTIVKSDRDQVALATLPGGARLFVNGEPFVGDVYGYGHEGVPVPLRKGKNTVFVRGVRGQFRLAFREVEPGVHILLRDATLPDLVAGLPLDQPASVVVANTSDRTMHNVPPLGVRRMAVTVRHPAVPEPGRVEIELEPSLGLKGTFPFDVRDPRAARRVTFFSGIDGSVQYYGVKAPSNDDGAEDTLAGIVLTLHGAGVHARNQADCYANKKDLWIIAPTNRRPFGFDWQDWGRKDAYEVLKDATGRFSTLESRVYLTGHSMGGHGTWHLGANDPDRWLAIAPCAAWESFDSYGRGSRDGNLADLWRGADLAGDTMTLLPNLAQLPTFILHGEADKTVPLEEAKRMEAALREAGGDPQVHYEPGKGHWYDGDASPGVDCVDWPGIFALFAAHPARDADPSKIAFLSADPSVDSEHYWLTYLQPQAYGTLAAFQARRDGSGTVLATQNVRRFRCAKAGKLMLDGEPFELETPAEFVRGATGWQIATPAPTQKSPARSGPFKRAFDRRFVLVYGATDKVARSRARIDAQLWWYYGNGDCTVVSDEQFRVGNYAGRNVILYGNAETNRAWESVVPEQCPIHLRQGEARLGKKTFDGRDLGCLLVYPRRGESEALVGVIGWTGAAGARATENIPLFSAGVGIPDYALFGADVLTKGDGGVRAAGWFDHAWQLVSEPAHPQ